MKKPVYLALCALVIIVVAVALATGHNSPAQNSQSASQSPVQQPLLIDSSISPSLQTPSSGINPQPSSTSSLPGSTELEGQNTGTTNWSSSPCYTCSPRAGHVCPELAC